MIVAFFVLSAILAISAYFMRSNSWNHILVITQSLLIGILVIYEYPNLGQTQFEYFKPDHLGLIFLAVLFIVSLLAAIHYISYTEKGKVDVRHVSIHNFGTILFNSAIAGVLLTNHFGVLWAFIEITTLAAAILIQHDRNEHSMEATWKYLFVCSMAIAIAFAGILFLGIATNEISTPNFSFEGIKAVVNSVNDTWLKACFLFIVTGFSVKMGLVPMFNVDIDAKDVSPSPVGALLSSAMLNAGFVAVYRFYEAFAHTSVLPWMNSTLIIIGVLSLFFAAVYMLKVGNIKRLLAYSSMEHAALAMLAFACGGVGYFAAIFHLILHSFVKSTIFLQVGQMHNIFGSKLDIDIKNYLRVNPIGAIVIVGGFISIIALPPSGLFISEFMIFQAIFESGRIWLLVLSFILMLFIIYAISTRILRMTFSNASSQQQLDLNSIRKWESAIQIAVLLAVFYMGFLKPYFLVEFIQLAIASLPQ
jgi:hydrogenase-4 component F